MSQSHMYLQAQCDQFNDCYPVGQRVTVRLDNGEGKSTVTRGPAYVLSGHSAVIALEGVSGCYMLDRVTPITSEAGLTAAKLRAARDILEAKA